MIKSTSNTVLEQDRVVDTIGTGSLISGCVLLVAASLEGPGNEASH